MPCNTLLLDFTISKLYVTSIERQIAFQNDVLILLSKHLSGLKIQHGSTLEDGGFILVLKGTDGSIVSMHAYPHGLVTCNIEFFQEEGEKKPLMSLESVRKLEKEFGDKFNSSSTHSCSPIVRGAYRYFNTADERLLEYDIDKIVYEERSPFQKIVIVHSVSLGNMLVLDDMQNIAESDLIYTETLMQRGKENYEGKEIIILGGGDGALLWELLKEKPKYVTMLEIDEMVMQACREHLRSICGDCLDKFKTDNYEIIVGDCVVALDRFVTEGRKFDYVFGDLTDIPLSSSPEGEMWDFIRLILNNSMAVLKDSGKYMTHGNGSSCPKSLKMFEKQLTQLKVPVEYTTDHAYVPSFMEDWVFYQVWKKQ